MPSYMKKCVGHMQIESTICMNKRDMQLRNIYCSLTQLNLYVKTLGRLSVYMNLNTVGVLKKNDAISYYTDQLSMCHQITVSVKLIYVNI